MESKLKLKTVEIFLQQVQGFSHKPDWKLEQYLTPPRLGAEILFSIYQNYNDFEGNIVTDLGCGTGMLMLGALRIGAEFTVGFDIDQRCILQAQKNIEEFGLQDYTDLILQQIGLSGGKQYWKDSKADLCDAVIMNPPFGTKKETQNLDMRFLDHAIGMTTGPIYSIHKSSTRKYIEKYVNKQGRKMEFLYQDFKYPLPKTMKSHKKARGMTVVDIIRVYTDA